MNWGGASHPGIWSKPFSCRKARIPAQFTAYGLFPWANMKNCDRLLFLYIGSLLTQQPHRVGGPSNPAQLLVYTHEEGRAHSWLPAIQQPLFNTPDTVTHSCLCPGNLAGQQDCAAVHVAQGSLPELSASCRPVSGIVTNSTGLWISCNPAVWGLIIKIPIPV